MSGNPTLNRLIRQTIYDLKHRFGAEVTVYKVVDSTTNYKTGAKSIDTTSRAVRKAIVLPSTLSREIFQSVSYLSASKSFASLGGQGWDETSRGFIFDGRDLQDYDFELEDWIVYRGKRYDIQTIEALEWDTGWMIVAKEVKGQVSGGGPQVDVAQSLPVTQAVSETEDISLSLSDDLGIGDDAEDDLETP